MCLNSNLGTPLFSGAYPVSSSDSKTNNEEKSGYNELSFCGKAALNIWAALCIYNFPESEQFDRMGAPVFKRPEEYRYIEEEKEDLYDMIQTEYAYNADKTSLYKRADALIQKQQDQDKLADITSDGKYIYFKLHLSKSDSPYVEKSGGTLKISAENFKKMFDIKDGRLKDYNYDKFKNSFTWTKKPFEEAHSMRDFTEARLNDGETYKVPINAVNKGDKINLDDYLPSEE